MKKRLMIALCCLVLLVQFFPIVPMADTVDVANAPQVSQDLYYCYAQLGELPNGEALRFAYNNIVEGIDACAEEIEISNGRYQLSMDEFLLALEAVRRDHTEQFWLSTAYSYTLDNDGNLAKMLPQYLMVGEELADAKVAFNQAIDGMLAYITPSMTDYEKEKTLHDLLANKVTYVSANNAHNAYGALVEGLAVCEGYAEALQCLLQRVGIQSIQVYGESRDENHAWNMVLIDGEYYLVDLTWNDQDNYNMLLYAYFNQTHEVFDEDHLQWRVGNQVQKDGSIRPLNCEVFDLPECTATKAAYFKGDFVIDDYTIESIAELLKNNKFAVSVFVESDVTAFDAWFRENILTIATTAGVSSNFGYNCIILGREVYIYIDACTHTQLKTVTAKAATCEEAGNIAYYICQEEDCGKFFLIERDADNNLVEIINRESVNVLPQGHKFETKTVSDATLKKKAEKCTERDTYFFTCSVCHEVSDTYTFETDVIGAHAYSDTWESGDVMNHKRVCSNGCGIDITEAHDKNGEDSSCSVCGYKFSIADVIPDIDAGEVADDVISIILSNPLILLGGGGSVALLVIVVIIQKIRQG